MKINLFVACEIQYFELEIFFFNLYVYYLTHGFIASTSAFNLIICARNLQTRAFSLPICAFNLTTRVFRVLARGFELVTRRFEFVTRNECFTSPRLLLFAINLLERYGKILIATDTKTKLDAINNALRKLVNQTENKIGNKIVDKIV